MSFNFGYSYGFAYYGWWWPYYHSYWYPYWYRHHYVPVYYPVYYPQETTVVVESYDTVPAQEVVYEEPAPAEPVAQTGGRSSIAIAAERYLTLGDRAFREGRYSDAVQLYAKAVDFAPDDAPMYLVLADALFAAGDYHYAAFVIRKAFELDASLVDSAVDKRDFYGDPSEFDRHLATLEHYLIDHPTDRDSRLVLAVNYLFSERPGDAEDLLRRPEASSLVAEEVGALVLRSATARVGLRSSDDGR